MHIRAKCAVNDSVSKRDVRLNTFFLIRQLQSYKNGIQSHFNLVKATVFLAM